MSNKRLASSPLIDSDDKRQCLQSIDSSFVDSESDPDATIIDTQYTSSCVTDSSFAMADTDTSKSVKDEPPPRLLLLCRPRPPRIYINDDMTQLRAEIAAAARASKKKGKVTDTWVRDGVVFVKTGDTVHRVTTRRMLGVVLNA
ncbi:hypothetical protein ACOMHN_002221 [Nucella lapillus]